MLSTVLHTIDRSKVYAETGTGAGTHEGAGAAGLLRDNMGQPPG
jgi:hypothetical protein